MNLLVILVLAAPTFCDEKPSELRSRSVGRPSKGSVEGAVALTESEGLVILPNRHKKRCLAWGVPRLVAALERAGAQVQRRIKNSAPLGVGDLGRARGGSLVPYSKSHQAGRDADLAFYFVNGGVSAQPDDLHHVDDSLSTANGLTFDVARNWALVAALLSDRSIRIKWVFVSEALRRELLRYAREVKAEEGLVAQAEEVLHQPSDAPPHDDHFHLRIRCTADERAGGCVD